ncbi:hypothetical protein PGB90_005768 [Kerria lacca]
MNFVNNTVYSEADVKEWDSYKKKFGKSYENEEDQQRMKKYFETKANIEEHNKLYEQGKTTFKMGINQFADMDKDEMPCFGQSNSTLCQSK